MLRHFPTLQRENNPRRRLGYTYGSCLGIRGEVSSLGSGGRPQETAKHILCQHIRFVPTKMQRQRSLEGTEFTRCSAKKIGKEVGINSSVLDQSKGNSAVSDPDRAVAA